MQNREIIGKCSCCGGEVSKPIYGYSVDPSYFNGSCEKCGAKENKIANMPTIPMHPEANISMVPNDNRGFIRKLMPF